VATTGLVLAALVAGWVDVPVDRVATAIIVVVVARTGWVLLADALLDASRDRHTLARISQTIAADPAVSELKWITGRNAGRLRFVEAGVALRVSARDAAEAAVRRIETTVRSAVPHIDRVVIQVEPAASSTSGTRSHWPIPPATVSDHFGQAPYFTFEAAVLVEQLDGVFVVVDQAARAKDSPEASCAQRF
jgi:divalent metal cation (Fe/Co/Zn/Cd) transporter